MSKQLVKKSVKLRDDVKLSKQQKSQVKALVKGVQQLKFFNTSNASQLVDWAGAIVAISNPTQGNGDTQRNGDTIKCTSLNITYSLRNPATGPNLEQYCRFIIFRWLPLDSTAPVLGDIMNMTGNAIALYSQYNDDRRDQFEVLYDRLHRISSDQIGGSPTRDSCVFQHYVKCNKKIEFNAGSINGTGKIYMLYVGDADPAIGATRTQISYYNTLRYTNS